MPEQRRDEIGRAPEIHHLVCPDARRQLAAILVQNSFQLIERRGREPECGFLLLRVEVLLSPRRLLRGDLVLSIGVRARLVPEADNRGERASGPGHAGAWRERLAEEMRRSRADRACRLYRDMHAPVGADRDLVLAP